MDLHAELSKLIIKTASRTLLGTTLLAHSFGLSSAKPRPQQRPLSHPPSGALVIRSWGVTMGSMQMLLKHGALQRNAPPA